VVGWGNYTTTKPTENGRAFDIDGRMTAFRLGDPQTTGLRRALAYDSSSRITAFTDTGANLSARHLTRHEEESKSFNWRNPCCRM
jgi:hypothetical protein